MFQLLGMINGLLKKVKDLYQDNKQDIYIAATIFLVGLSSFGLGRLSLLWPKREPIIVEESKGQASFLPYAPGEVSPTTRHQSAAVLLNQGKYVASKGGTAYHYPWCASAQKIKEENKIWFQTKEEAESRGYKPAENCEGL